MQLSLGIPLEMVHKGLRVGLVYLAGVIAGQCSEYNTESTSLDSYEVISKGNTLLHQDLLHSNMC